MIALLLFAVGWDDGLQTTAERTGYEKTSRYADVVSFCDRLAKRSPLVRLGDFGLSHEGRKLPLVVVADPPTADAEAAKKSGKLVLFVLANIHAGEVDGKEAALAFARELTTGADKELLKHLVFVFAPIFNADGNERFGENRPSQAGPKQVGIRPNAQQLDLNRDFVKLESPEVRNLVQALNAWDPAVFVDLHTTNGSLHRYALTFEAGYCPAGDSRLSEFARGRLLPFVSRKMEESTGYKSTFYGNFSADRSKWETVPPTPRYGVHYFVLQNRLSILSESYSYSPFPERVAASKAFVKEIARFAAEHHDEIKRLLKDVRSDALKPPMETDQIALRQREAPQPAPSVILGFVEEGQGRKRRSTGVPKEYPVVFMGGWAPTLSVRRPLAYAMPAIPKMIENLKRHGIQTETPPVELEAEVEVYRIDKITRGRTFQGHQPTTVEATIRKERRRLPAGTVMATTSQRLGRLAAYLLEPQAADGLVHWNFFDEHIAEGKDFPVVRVLAK